MKKEGYAGAGEMRSFVEYLWGWDATVPDLVDDAKWKETFDVYVQDKDKLGMKEFFEKNSPFAYQDITARMVETIRKGYWKADAATTEKLLREYVESVNQHGVGCSEHTCGNPRFQKYVTEQAKAAGIPVPAIEGFRRAMERATESSINAAAKAAEDFVRRNEAAPPETSRNAVPSPLQGYLMEMEERSRSTPAQASNASRPSDWDGIWVAVPMLAVLFGWRWRRSRG
jgi:cobaltochelatase CobN